MLAQAPDAASTAAATKLARAAAWSELGANEALVWGRCQGSGRTPYQVTVDLTGPAFRCTCPSRKFPCKHGLALLLLWSDGGGSVADAASAPGFADEWAESRVERAARVADKAATKTPVDPEAAAKRLAQRIERTTDGLTDLERWLGDLVRGGLGAARSQPNSWWDEAAARLVDAQVPGLAGRIREWPAVLVSGDDWTDRIAGEIGRAWLTARAWPRRDALDDARTADLRTALGWPTKVEDVVAAGTARTGRWQVLGVSHDERGALASQRTWLRAVDDDGHPEEAAGFVLDFAVAGAALPIPLATGTVVRATATPYPGSSPTRLHLGEERAPAGRARFLPEATTVDGALGEVATSLATDPWATVHGVSLASVRIVVTGGDVWALDVDGDALPIDPSLDPAAPLAVTGGAACSLFGEWNGRYLRPLTLVVDGEVVVW